MGSWSSGEGSSSAAREAEGCGWRREGLLGKDCAQEMVRMGDPQQWLGQRACVPPV